MEFSVNTEYLRHTQDKHIERTDLEAALICKKAGFSVLDVSPAFLGAPDWEAQAEGFANELAKLGMRVEQCHAPTNRYTKAPIESFSEQMWRCFKIARILGEHHVVVHADEYPTELPFDADAACDHAYEFFAPYVEYAAKHGFTVAIENVFDDCFPKNEAGRNRFCSTLEEMISIIDRFGTPAVTACWDTGHARVAFGKDGPAKMKALGSRLSCTHIHDNSGWDAHMPLYYGDIDWKAYADVFKESYTGVFTYEFVYHRFPEETLSDYIALAKKTGELLFS